jgi:hypothetical protein
VEGRCHEVEDGNLELEKRHIPTMELCVADRRHQSEYLSPRAKSKSTPGHILPAVPSYGAYLTCLCPYHVSRQGWMRSTG